MTESKLGRSFKDLMEENERAISANEEIVELEINIIRPNPDQPRTVFDEKSMLELADSIRQHGVFQPVIVKPSGGTYTLVAGERRVRASRLAGLTKVPAIIRDYNAVYLSELAILENLQREDLTPIEEAIAFQKAIFNLKLTHEELGKKIGKSRAYVTNIMGLLNLPAAVIDDVNKGRISMGHARALSKLKDNLLCVDLSDRIIAEGLTVRDIEGIIRNLSTSKEKFVIKPEKLHLAEEKIQKKIDKNIKFKVKKNKIEFTFQNEIELNEIVDLLTKRGN
jgi:ParB family chromosome partitioning protein